MTNIHEIFEQEQVTFIHVLQFSLELIIIFKFVLQPVEAHTKELSDEA
jgi:hypothetical protein